MGTKETGSTIVAKCPICLDELISGWIRDDIPTLSSKQDLEAGTVKQKIPQKNSDGLSNEKLTCTCGNISVEFKQNKGRVTIDWVTTEPAVGNINIH